MPTLGLRLEQLHERLDRWAAAWLLDAIVSVSLDARVLHRQLPEVAEQVGTAPLEGGCAEDVRSWTVDDVAHTLLLRACGHEVGTHLFELYRNGAQRQRRGILRALPYLPVGDMGLFLVDEALRGDDPAVAAAALGPYAHERLDAESLAGAMTRLVRIGVPNGELPSPPVGEPKRLR